MGVIRGDFDRLRYYEEINKDMNDDLLYEIKDGAAILTINRESRRNAISQEMITAFINYLERADQDENVRAVCITGAGEKAFCSGADLAVTLAGKEEERLSGPRNYAALLKSMAKFGKPMVAKVNGPCLAGGLGLMLSCDIILARNDTFFRTPEVNVGIFPMMVGALLYRNVQRKKAVDMVLTGRKIPAPEAERMGLITRAVEPERLDNEIQETLRLLTSKSPIGLRIGKEAFRTMSDMAFEEAVDYLCEALGRAISTEDAMEGMMAFMEKRPPNFKGK
jgi:enoyl-CoA hydratase/carnithine racemase